MHAREDKHGDTARRPRRPATPPTRAPGLAPPGAPAASQLHAMQGLVGNQVATEVLGRTGTPRAGGLAVQRAPAGQSTQPAPLTHGNVRFVNVSQKSPEYVDKAVRILELLGRHTIIQNFLRAQGKPAHIELVQRSGSPADVTVLANHVQVNIAHYYFQGYDVSYITGMLAHEFGIHPIANANQEAREDDEAWQGMPALVPGLENDTPPGMMNTDNLTPGVGQPSHITGANPSTQRHRIYRDVALEFGRLLLQDAQSQREGARPEQVTELLDCFLMDVASIASTNDYRSRGAWNPGKVAKVYNAYKAMLPLAPNDPLKPLLPQDKVTSAVAADFATLTRRIAAGLFNTSSIQR